MRRALAAIGVVAGVLALLWVARGRGTDVTAGRESVESESIARASRAQTASEVAASREQMVATTEQLVVQVVDGKGRPRAGIDIALAWLPREESDPVLYDLGVTEGVEGICRITTIRAAIERGRAAADRMRGYGVTIRGVGIATKVVTLDVEHLPTDVVRLVLPACGSVVARLVDAKGQPIRQGIMATLELREPGSQIAVSSHDAYGSFTGRPTRFPVVALGKDLLVRCQCLGLGWLEDQRRAGPMRDGEEIEITWRVADENAILTGTIVTPDGRPAQIASMYLHAALPRGGTAEAACSTGEDGRFRVALGARVCEQKMVTLFLEERSDTGETGRCVIAKLEHILHAGAQDLGTFTFATPPLVAGIDVVDRAGAPVGDANVGVLGREFLSKWDASQPLWHRHVGPARHEFYGYTTQDDLRALAGHAEYLTSDEIPFRRGTKDLRVVLEKGGSIAVTVRVDDAIEPLVQLRRSDGKRVNLAEPKQRTTPQVEFAWTGLQPGAYALAITLPEESEPMLTLAGLQVEGGKPCDDPRLASLDLRSRVRRVTLTVTTADGKPLANSGVLVTPLSAHDRERRFASRADARGQQVLLLSKPSIDVLVGARDHRSRELRGLDRDTTIALARGLLVRTRLAPITIPSDVQVYCYASKIDAPWRAAPGSSRQGPASTTELNFAEPGAYALSYCIASDRNAALLTTQRIDVLDQPEPQLFEITCTAQELATALAKLGK